MYMKKTTNRIRRLQIALALRAHAILLSLKNLLCLLPPNCKRNHKYPADRKISAFFFSISRPILLEKQTVPWRKLSLAGVSSFLVSDLLPMLQNIRLPHPHLTPYFLVSLTPLVQISFSSQPSAAIKIKDGGHDFR